MKQSRLMSLVESLANVLVGYGVAVVTQMLVFPLFGLAVTVTENLLIGLIFTAVSIVRSYALRRGFEALRVRQSAMASSNASPSPRYPVISDALPPRACERASTAPQIRAYTSKASGVRPTVSIDPFMSRSWRTKKSNDSSPVVRVQPRNGSPVACMTR